MAPRENPTVAKYCEEWLELCAGLKPSTRALYRQHLRLRVLPALARKRLRSVKRRDVKRFLGRLLDSGVGKPTVDLTLSTVRAMFATALQDGLVDENPAAGGVRKALGLTLSKRDRSEKVRAFRREQLEAFLEGAEEGTSRALFYLMSRTGFRLGEALGLRWDDLDQVRRRFRLERQLAPDGSTTSPKSGHGRDVDIGETALARFLELHPGEGPRSRGWLFDSGGRPLSHRAAQGAFRRARGRAGLPRHLTSHCLRHTYASVLLAAGVSPAYVQEQLGHASLELTVGVYGRWLKKQAPGALELLETGGTWSGPSAVAEVAADDPYRIQGSSNL